MSKSLNHGIFLLLGSNQGEPRENLRRARESIRRQAGDIVSTSAEYKSAAWGFQEQPDFYNQVIEIRTVHDPEALLDTLLSIEAQLGRVRRRKWGPRIIDIDILFYGDRILNSEKLSVPHPGIPARRFTLLPLAEIAPGTVHPVTGKSITTMLSECRDAGAVEKLDEIS